MPRVRDLPISDSNSTHLTDSVFGTAYDSKLLDNTKKSTQVPGQSQSYGEMTCKIRESVPDVRARSQPVFWSVICLVLGAVLIICDLLLAQFLIVFRHSWTTQQIKKDLKGF